jgi:murein endopeptidase
VRLGVIRHVPLHADHLHVRFQCASGDAQCISSTTSASSNHDD